MTKVTYIEFDESQGYPFGPEIQYECLDCGESLPSAPKHAVACKCRNVIIDADAGRVSVKRHDIFRISREII